jgi:hypothetical protein
MGNFGNKKRNKNRHKKVDIETKSEGKSSEEPDQSEKKEDRNNNIRNSDGLDKNDVEKDLDDIDKSEKLQDSELMDMDADMRLQRAVVEKDMGNECFKAGKYNKALKENSLPALNCWSDESKVKSLFVPKSGLLTSQLISSKIDSTKMKTCIIDCAVGIKDLKQDRNKEPLQSRLERDDVKQNFTKNYIKKEIVESNIVPKKSNVNAKKRNSN